jgi:hypothetical protein
MSLEELQAAVARLSFEEASLFARWLEEHLADAWDRQIEEDIRAGKFDALARRVDEAFEKGECRPLLADSCRLQPRRERQVSEWTGKTS